MIDLCTVNYNTWPLLTRQITALNLDPNAKPGYKLYIADNNSTDNSRQAMEAMFPDSQAMAKVNIAFFTGNRINIGYANACNQLAAYGTGDIIGLLNADVWLTNDDVLAIQQSFDSDPEIAILGPKQRDEDGNITHAGIFGTNDRPKHRGWKEPDPGDTKFRDLLDAVTVSGAAYFIRRSVWDELRDDEEYNKVIATLIDEELIPYPLYRGAFLPTKHYYEETFCSYFANHRGHKVFYDGRVSIGHSWHASHAIGSPQDRLFKESQRAFRRACDLLGIDHD